MILTAMSKFAAIVCDPRADSQRFLNLPFWYEYLPGETDSLGKCIPTIDIMNSPADLWLIGLALIDILLRVAAMVAVGFVIYGGFKYMTSGGAPDQVKSAKDTVLNALIGAVIAIVAASIVSFIGNRIG